MAGNGRNASARIPRMPKVPGEKKTWTFKLTVPGLVCSAGMAGLALTLFFILGLLVGRGYRVEENVPRLAAMMPDKHGAEQTNTDGASPEIPEVLKPEELSYPDTLSQPPVKNRAEAPEPEKTAPKPQPEKAATPKAKPEPVAAPAPKPGEKVYDYVYQAASFRERSMAQSLSGKLVKAGLDSRVEAGETSSGTWYRVVIMHRGTPDSTASMKAVLDRFGIGKPLMKQKKPVAN